MDLKSITKVILTYPPTRSCYMPSLLNFSYATCFQVVHKFSIEKRSSYNLYLFCLLSFIETWDKSGKRSLIAAAAQPPATFTKFCETVGLKIPEIEGVVYDQELVKGKSNLTEVTV